MNDQVCTRNIIVAGVRIPVETLRFIPIKQPHHQPAVRCDDHSSESNLHGERK